jgi:hypothetical protein
MSNSNVSNHKGFVGLPCHAHPCGLALQILKSAIVKSTQLQPSSL